MDTFRLKRRPPPSRVDRWLRDIDELARCTEPLDLTEDLADLLRRQRSQQHKSDKQPAGGTTTNRGLAGNKAADRLQQQKKKEKKPETSEAPANQACSKQPTQLSGQRQRQRPTQKQDRSRGSSGSSSGGSSGTSSSTTTSSAIRKDVSKATPDDSATNTEQLKQSSSDGGGGGDGGVAGVGEGKDSSSSSLASSLDSNKMNVMRLASQQHHCQHHQHQHQHQHQHHNQRKCCHQQHGGSGDYRLDAAAAAAVKRSPAQPPLSTPPRPPPPPPQQHKQHRHQPQPTSKPCSAIFHVSCYLQAGGHRSSDSASSSSSDAADGSSSSGSTASSSCSRLLAKLRSLANSDPRLAKIASQRGVHVCLDDYYAAENEAQHNEEEDHRQRRRVKISGNSWRAVSEAVYDLSRAFPKLMRRPKRPRPRTDSTEVPNDQRQHKTEPAHPQRHQSQVSQPADLQPNRQAAPSEAPAAYKPCCPLAAKAITTTAAPAAPPAAAGSARQAQNVRFHLNTQQRENLFMQDASGRPAHARLRHLLATLGMELVFLERSVNESNMSSVKVRFFFDNFDQLTAFCKAIDYQLPSQN